MHENLSYKIIAVLLAVALWFYVLLTEENPIVQRRVQVPLHVGQAAAGLAVSSQTTEVDVVVTGPKRIVNGLPQSAVQAKLAAADLTRGSHQARVLVTLPAELRGEPDPGRVPVVVEPTAGKTLPVECFLQGSPPPGVVPGTPQVNPAMVRVSGPGSVVEQVAHIQAFAKSDLAGLPGAQVVAVRPVNEYGAIVEGVTLDPGRVRARIPAERRLDYKTVPITVRPDGVPAGLRVVSLTVDPVVVTLGGESRALAAITHLSAGSVDLSAADAGVIRRTLTLQAPPGLLLLDARRVQVRVELAQVAPAAPRQPAPAPPADTVTPQ